MSRRINVRTGPNYFGSPWRSGPMRRILIMAMLAAATAAGTLSQTRSSHRSARSHKVQPSQLEKELKELERQWLDAYTQRDAKAMERIEAEDFTITSPNSRGLTKADEIANVKKEAAMTRDNDMASNN